MKDMMKKKLSKQEIRCMKLIKNKGGIDDNQC